MPDDDVHVRLIDPEEIAEQMRSKRYWFLFFEEGTGVDDMDKAIGHYPTHPTAVIPTSYGFFMVTIVPKAKLSRARLERLINKTFGRGSNNLAVGPTQLAPGQDMICFAHEGRAALEVLQLCTNLIDRDHEPVA